MMPSTHLYQLLAQAESAASDVPNKLTRLDQISENLNSDSLISSHGLLIAAGLIMLLLSCLSFLQWFKHRHEHSHPWLTFISAANFAGLGLRHQWALFWIARQQKLTSPITLMLAPGTFDQHVQRYLDARPNFRRESMRRTAQNIRELLFGDAIRQ